MGNRSLPYRELIKRLRKLGVHEVAERGKGSHRMLVRIHGGRTLKYPIAYHGAKRVVAGGVIKALRRALNLSEEDGVPDEEFYS